MKWFAGTAVGLMLAALSAEAQTAIQPGLWEVTDKTTMEGVQPTPAVSKRVCVKGAEAILERLIYPPRQEVAKHACNLMPSAKQAAGFNTTTSGSATEQLRARH